MFYIKRLLNTFQSRQLIYGQDVLCSVWIALRFWLQKYFCQIYVMN